MSLVGGTIACLITIWLLWSIGVARWHWFLVSAALRLLALPLLAQFEV
jgi:hypothetical protein